MVWCYETEEDMLRITAMPDGASSVTLKVEGRIVSEWVGVLEQECQAWLRQGCRVLLDFSQVSYIDSGGVQTLKKMPEQVRVCECSSVIADLLKGEDSP